jgi:hypothetical protein
MKPVPSWKPISRNFTGLDIGLKNKKPRLNSGVFRQKGKFILPLCWDR